MKNIDFTKKLHFKLSHCNDIGQYSHVIDEEIENSLKEINKDINLSSFQPKKKLNNKIWINNLINSRVRLRLLDIADDFINTLEIDWVKPIDIILTGSLANYNWSKYSDFDLHILYDFKKIDKRVKFIKDYFDSKKNEWNNTHENLTIYGHNVEIYVQNIAEEHIATGVYSLEKNKWLINPEPNNIKAIQLNKYFIKNKSLQIIKSINKLDKYINNTDDDVNLRILSNKVKKIFDKVKWIRKQSLVKNGEMGSGNIIYKILRRTNYIEKLLKLKAKTYDKLKSIN